jgi:hypothetical protein
MVSSLSFCFSSLQSLQSKVSYEPFYHKHCKKKGNNHNPFLGYSPNLFFLPKLKKYIQNKKNKSKKNNSSEKRMAEHL